MAYRRQRQIRRETSTGVTVNCGGKSQVRQIRRQTSTSVTVNCGGKSVVRQLEGETSTYAITYRLVVANYQQTFIFTEVADYYGITALYYNIYKSISEASTYYLTLLFKFNNSSETVISRNKELKHSIGKTSGYITFTITGT